MRIYYLRDKKNVQGKSDGSFTKGNPFAVIASQVDRERDVIHYAIAMLHREDYFVKARGLQIVRGRLEEKPTSIRGVPETGHEITQKIMNDIFANNLNASRKVRNFARKWLCEASKPRT